MSVCGKSENERNRTLQKGTSTLHHTLHVWWRGVYLIFFFFWNWIEFPQSPHAFIKKRYSYFFSKRFGWERRLWAIGQSVASWYVTLSIENNNVVYFSFFLFSPFFFFFIIRCRHYPSCFVVVSFEFGVQSRETRLPYLDIKLQILLIFFKFKAKLRQELVSVLGDGPITSQNLSSLKYLKYVLDDDDGKL